MGIGGRLVALTLTADSFNSAQADPNKPKKVAAFQSGIHTTAEGKRRNVVRLRMGVSNLPDGVYQVAISNGVETTTKAVTLSTKQPVAPPRLVAVQ
ncbi:hypothetical protein LX87_05643 [Larkinella arboricola]|uniref:Uncharacterized protein n=1 Tax=Larkinella arboricola TaxID=643671 RepID=A0A327WIS0_LARAB|nr:hypothetical protein [Larkinella arboricola]RAJ89874.1 hypothetical protein LX87_05643 [Larkinella arboricola]